MDVLQLLRNFRIIQKWSRHACLFNIHSAMEEMSMGFFTGEKKILNSAKNAKLLYSCSVHLKLSWSFLIVMAILQFSWQSEMENFMIKCASQIVFSIVTHKSTFEFGGQYFELHRALEPQQAVSDGRLLWQSC